MASALKSKITASRPRATNNRSPLTLSGTGTSSPPPSLGSSSATSPPAASHSLTQPVVSDDTARARADPRSSRQSETAPAAIPRIDAEISSVAADKGDIVSSDARVLDCAIGHISEQITKHATAETSKGGFAPVEEYDDDDGTMGERGGEWPPVV